MQAGMVDLPDFLEIALEALDEEYGDPDEWSKPTDAMRAAEKVFKRAILADYKPFMMDRVATEKIDVVEWARENAADVFDRIEWSGSP